MSAAVNVNILHASGIAPEKPARGLSIGTSELAGALGMLLAIGFHLTHDEAKFTPMTLVLGALAAFVAWGGFRKAPIAERGKRSLSDRRI